MVGSAEPNFVVKFFEVACHVVFLLWEQQSHTEALPSTFIFLLHYCFLCHNVATYKAKKGSGFEVISVSLNNAKPKNMQKKQKRNRVHHEEKPESISGAEIKFRCEKSLKQRFQKIAAKKHKKHLTLAREVIWQYVEEQEKILGITSETREIAKDMGEIGN